MAIAGDKNTLFASGQADTLRLIAYLTAAVALMVTDHHSHYLDRARAALGGLATPLYRVAQAPVEASRWLWAAASERVALKRENDALRGELLLARARLNAARIESEQNLRLRELLETGRRYRLSGRMVEVFQVDLDPSRQRVLLDGGSASGVRVGQPVIDAWGLVGQVVSTTAGTASIMLLTDPEHAVPVRNARTGQRAVAYGSGRDDRIVLPSLPMNSDLQVGDELLTSGLGGRFPAGFPVAVVREVGVDENGIFAQAVAEPFARLRLSSELLLLEEIALPADGDSWPLEEAAAPAEDPAGVAPGAGR